MTRWITTRWGATPAHARAAPMCVVAALVGLILVGCASAQPPPAPTPTCVLPAGQTAWQSLTLSYLGDVPALRVTTGTAVNVIVPEYAHQALLISSVGDVRIACLATAHRGGDGSVTATFLALRLGTSTITGTLAHATHAMMPGFAGKLIVVGQ
jgi:hypothetical protein